MIEEKIELLPSSASPQTSGQMILHKSDPDSAQTVQDTDGNLQNHAAQGTELVVEADQNGSLSRGTAQDIKLSDLTTEDVKLSVETAEETGLSLETQNLVLSTGLADNTISDEKLSGEQSLDIVLPSQVAQNTTASSGESLPTALPDGNLVETSIPPTEGATTEDATTEQLTPCSESVALPANVTKDVTSGIDALSQDDGCTEKLVTNNVQNVHDVQTSIPIQSVPTLPQDDSQTVPMLAVSSSEVNNMNVDITGSNTEQCVNNMDSEAATTEPQRAVTPQLDLVSDSAVPCAASPNIDAFKSAVSIFLLLKTFISIPVYLICV